MSDEANAAIALIPWLAVVLIVLHDTSEDWPKGIGKQRAEANSANEQAEKNTDPVAAKDVKDDKAYERSHKRKERAYWRASITIGAIGVIGAVCAAIFARGAFIEAHNQAVAAEGQLVAMRDEQRPWIKVTVDTIKGFGNYKGIRVFFVSFGMKNVGHSPAFNIQFFQHVYAYYEGSVSITNKQRLDCDVVRKTPLKTDAPAGVIFPGDYIIDKDLGGRLPACFASRIY